LGVDGSPYYYADDNYYQWDGVANEYETVSAPPDIQRQAANQSPNLVAYPKNSQSDAQQAQAEREKQARVILGSAEAAIAGKFVEAAAIYAGHPVALQLRAMNIIYETTKERGATILMPSSNGR
jgi:hypothetical protein